MSITRSITRPIARGISRGIVRGGLDPDAAAYIAAVETALSSSITADQKNAINDFIKTGKSDGWYSSIKRLYLPIWADAAANAIDMISRTGGTFSASGVTHATGYVQGDGSTGYFDMGVGMSGQGLTGTDSCQFVLAYVPGAGGMHIGAFTTAYISYLPFFLANGAAVNKSAVWSAGGIQLWSTESGPDTYVANRSSLGWSLDDAGIGAPTTGAPAANVYALARNNGGVQFPTSGSLGGYGFGLGLTQTQAEDFTLSLQTLWETASGLTLP